MLLCANLHFIRGTAIQPLHKSLRQHEPGTSGGEKSGTKSCALMRMISSRYLVETAALTKLWRANSYAASVAQLVDLIEQVQDIEADFDGCLFRNLDPAREMQVECLVGTALL